MNAVSEELKFELESFIFNISIPEEMPLIFVDFGLMEQVLHNLVLNATQHAPKGSEIDVKIEIADGFLIINIIDEGPGFPESELSLVFDKFYRGKDAKTGGTGLGLSIAKGFVEAHQGMIDASNAKKGGAVFTIKIPYNAMNSSY
ncbi:Sensor protein KdpD [bioreactor metagenome]|uniref:Sensor protein KdpD n=1 Tax=bioreactor metagenome TaxID=1076179 RepID=A0A645DNI2_9ZZZZ